MLQIQGKKRIQWVKSCKLTGADTIFSGGRGRKLAYKLTFQPSYYPFVYRPIIVSFYIETWMVPYLNIILIFGNITWHFSSIFIYSPKSRGGHMTCPSIFLRSYIDMYCIKHSKINNCTIKLVFLHTWQVFFSTVHWRNWKKELKPILSNLTGMWFSLMVTSL